MIILPRTYATVPINTPELVEAYQEGHLKGKLKEIAAGMHEEDNPVIMVAKYKR